MTKPNQAPTETVAPPQDLAIVLRAMGLGASLTIHRLDGAPLSDRDRAMLPALLEGYALGRELQPTDDEIASAAEAVLAGRVAATGTDG